MYFIFLDLGLGAGPFLLGYMIPVLGYRGMYVAMVGVILVSVFIDDVMHGRKDQMIFTQSSERKMLLKKG